MWKHYRKTFTGIQAVIWIVSTVIYFSLGHSLSRAATFFVVMQLSAVIGALWAARLKALVERRSALPLRAVD